MSDPLLKHWKEHGYIVEHQEIKDDDVIKVKFRGKEREIKLTKLIIVTHPEKNSRFTPYQAEYPEEFQPLLGMEMFCHGEQVKCGECGSTHFDFDAWNADFYCSGCGIVMSTLNIIKPELEPVPFWEKEGERGEVE